MKAKIDNFHGIQPRIHPALLGAGMAVRAHNCRLKNGKLVPLRMPSVVDGARVYREGGLVSIADAVSLHPWKWISAASGVGVNFFAFKGVAWMTEGNVADDKFDRVFVTGATGVPFTGADGVMVEDTPAVFLHERGGNSVVRRTLVKDALAVSGDDGAERTESGAGPDEARTIYYAAFFVSWFDEYGYESGLSGASNIVAFNDNDTVTLHVRGVPANAAGVRVYMTRSGTDETGSGIQHIYDKTTDLAPGNMDVAFKANLADAGEAEPGIEPVPKDLQCLQYVPGGFYAGFSKSQPKTVMFSDLGAPTSWPVAYRYDVKDNIVALAATVNTVYALTDGWPWVLSGTAPDTMTAAKLAGPAACVSPRGVCVYRNGVYFVSHEGLMAIVSDADAGTVCANVTEKAFTKDQWLALNPSSCVMLQHDGALHLFFRKPDGTLADGLVIDLQESADAITTHDESARCACVDVTTDTMYYVRAE